MRLLMCTAKAVSKLWYIIINFFLNSTMVVKKFEER